MAPLRYRRILQKPLKLTDEAWEFTVLDLPPATTCDGEGYMKSCGLTANKTESNLVLSLTRIPPNRAISIRPLSDFIHVTCADFRLHLDDSQPATFRESSDYLARFLKRGLILNGVQYSFYGHSNSQLKGRSCFLMVGKQAEVDREVEKLGDFTKLKTVAKKAKRIGLLFSTAQRVMDVDPSRCKDIADVEREDYIFTDGCGNISPSLAKLLVRKKPILFRNKRYMPSVFQIRYRGYKGVVVLEPKMQSPTWLELRKSMRKFSGGNDHSFSVVEYSKPYTYGYLNDETTLLLHALGIKREILESKQEDHLNFLDKASQNSRFAFRFLNSIGSFELAERVLLQGLDTVRSQVLKLVDQEHGKMLNKRNEYKCRILIPQSRLLFGVCDPYGVLQEGQCFVAPTHDDNGVASALIGTWILVARNPCLHPGDLQKLRVVARKELAHLVDCIVFPTNGRRPAADMMSGGDLDGDTFFVCWDSELVPSEISQPAEYPGAKEPVRFTPITTHDRIHYFSQSSSMQLGQVKNLFLRWARLKGPLSSECQELNRLFSQCVDASKIKIPPRLENPLQTSSPSEPFILDALHDSLRRRVEAYKRPSLIENVESEENLLAIIAEPGAMSQFQLAHLTWRWCQIRHTSFENFWRYFDPTQMSSEERAWILSQLPTREDLPETIQSDLVHSEILGLEELSSLRLRNACIRWRCVYSSTYERLRNLLDTLCDVFPFFTRKLLLLRIHDRLSVVIYLPLKIESMDDIPLATCGRLFAIPHSKFARDSSRVIVPTKHNSCLYYDRNVFQLFDGKRGNTFVFIRRAATDDSGFRERKGKGEYARARENSVQEGINDEWKTSIALNKFSEPLAKHVGPVRLEGITAAELYVISNTDTRSMRHLDLWLEQIDTDKVHSNFATDLEETPKTFAMADVDWEQETASVTKIARDEDFSNILSVSPAELRRALELAWLSCHENMAMQIFSRWVNNLACKKPRAPFQEIVSVLVRSLTFMPGLVINLVRLCPWKESYTHEMLIDYATQILHALILCGNRMGHLATSCLTEVLNELAELRIEDLKSMVEMVALTISRTETALDILLEGLDPFTSRLVLDSPRNSQYLVNQISAIVIDHIEEGIDLAKDSKSDSYHWRFTSPVCLKDDKMILTCDYRIDAPKSVRMAIGDHVRFNCVQVPPNVYSNEHVAFEAIVEKHDIGHVTLRCLRHPPSYFRSTSWTLQSCGSFVTAQTMFDAVTKLVVEKDGCCGVFQNLFPSSLQLSNVQIEMNLDRLNASQHQAVAESLTGPLTCIWGPPGTGKTHAIVSIIIEIVSRMKEARLLVTAPTHNAVDNVMRKFMTYASEHHNLANLNVLRVSTDIHKVANDLRVHTCDAMLGKDLNANPGARRKAQQQIAQSKLIFTTCIGAGLGLLRNERFEDVIIDEASQQTEPASLVPLVKGASRAILVGDHVQLRATVQPSAQALGFDISLFERLWTEAEAGTKKCAVRRVMLDTQYRMHPAVCAFPSDEFYEGRLKTAEHCRAIDIPPSSFPWPEDSHRSIFIQTSATEDLGKKSKSNVGQATICQKVIEQLRSPPVDPAKSLKDLYSIAILTPYTRQADLLKRLLPEERISSIDGFQGQEADVIVYVSVRSNLHGEIGFLKDMRRLNVVLTRARAGIIIIGDEATLTGKGRMKSDREAEENEQEDCYNVWRRLIRSCARTNMEVDAESAGS